jgi:hypothetical protein
MHYFASGSTQARKKKLQNINQIYIGLHFLQGSYPADSALLALEKQTKCSGFILGTHEQPGLWNLCVLLLPM